MSQPVPLPGGARGRRVVGPLFFVLVGLAIALPIVMFVVRSGDSPTEMASFDPGAPCAGADRQMWPGTFPELEARIPGEVAGVAPDRVDSGRFCSEMTLGSIYRSGITEVRFAGGQWPIGAETGLQLGVFSAPGLTVRAQADEYRRSAEANQGVTVALAREERIDGRPGYRLELTRSGSRQVIVVWPSADSAVVQSVIGVDVKDELVAEAIAAFR